MSNSHGEHVERRYSISPLWPSRTFGLDGTGELHLQILDNFSSPHMREQAFSKSSRRVISLSHMAREG